MAFTVQDLVAMPRVEAVAASPDGSWHAVEVHTVDEETGRYHPAIWRVDAEGAAPLLGGLCKYRQPRFRPDGRLAVLTNRPLDARDAEPTQRPDKDARMQVWLLDDEGLRPLTDEPLGIDAFRFAREGDRLFAIADVLPGVPHEAQRETAEDREKRGPSVLRYTSTPVRHWDHWIGKAAPHVIVYEGDDRRDLTPDADREHRGASWDVAPDGRTIAITSARPNRFAMDDLRLQLIDVATGASRFLVDVDDVVVEAPKFSADGSRLLFSRQRWEVGLCPRERLFVVNVDGSSSAEVAADWDRWGSPVGWLSSDRVLVAADDEGTHALFTIELSSDAVERQPLPEGTGHVGAVRIGEHGVVGVAHGLLRAPEAYRWAADGTITALTTFAGPPEPVPAHVERATVPGAGGDPVQYWLLLPKNASAPCSTVLWIHGGPIGAWNDQWHWRWNANVLLDQGYAVVLPNPRGSTGFGQAFVDGIWGNQWGAACYEDVLAVVDAVEADPRIDGSRTIAMGGSFGGYMTNWIGANTDRFVGLVTHASLVDLPMFESTTDHPPFWRFQFGVERFENRAEVERHSPLRAVAQWRTPTLVVHGERDYRVPISEALALFDALQHHGVESELVVFPDENHWILKPRNIVAWYEACLHFIGRHTQTVPLIG